MKEQMPIYEGPEYVATNEDGTETHRFPNGNEVTVKPFYMDDGAVGLDVDDIEAQINAEFPQSTIETKE